MKKFESFNNDLFKVSENEQIRIKGGMMSFATECKTDKPTDGGCDRIITTKTD